MAIKRFLLLIAVGLLAIGGTGPQALAQNAGGAPAQAAPPPAEVYVFRPMGGRLATREMDKIAAKLGQYGLKTSVLNYTNWIGPARRAASQYRKEDHKSPIIIIGHSEGALTASILGAEKFGKRRRRPAGIVYMAGSGRNLREVIYAQIRDSMTEKSDAEIEEAIAAARKIHDAAQNDGDMPATSEPLRDWMKEIFAQDPVANLKKLSVPVFAVQGAKDFQVDPKDDFGPVTEALGKAPKGSDSRLYEGLDHLFKPEPGESKVGHYYDLSRRVDPKFIADVVAWCSQRAGS